MTLAAEQRRELAEHTLLPWVERRKPLAGATVVDFGCGEGPVTEPLAERAERVIAVDIAGADVDRARERLAERGLSNAELHSGPFDELLAVVEDRVGVGGADVFLLAATLEHMLIAERLAVLRLARRVLAPDGVLVIWETPNRLLWSDHHSAQTPFFHMLPDELALAWVDRIPRRDMADAIAARTGNGTAEAVEELWRWGRGASFHEIELGFGAPGRRILAGGYDPATFGVRPVLRDELQLARYLEREAPEVHPAFSRYWLDLIMSREPAPEPPQPWRPWPFDDLDSAGVRISRWDLLHFMEPGAWLRFAPAEPACAVQLGVECVDQSVTLSVEGERSGAVVEVVAAATGKPRTAYVQARLPMPEHAAVLRARTPAVVSFVATA